MRGQLKAWGSWPAESCPRPFPHRPPSGKRTPSSTKHHTQKPNFEVPHVARHRRHLLQPKLCTVEEEGEGHPMASFATAPPLTNPHTFHQVHHNLSPPSPCWQFYISISEFLDSLQSSRLCTPFCHPLPDFWDRKHISYKLRKQNHFHLIEHFALHTVAHHLR